MNVGFLKWLSGSDESLIQGFVYLFSCFCFVCLFVFVEYCELRSVFLLVTVLQVVYRIF